MATPTSSQLQEPKLTLTRSISNKAMSVVDTSLQYAADGVETVHDAIFPSPNHLSTEDSIDGLYHSSVARFISGFRDQLKRGVPFPLTLQNAAALVDAIISAKFDGGIDDRLYLLEAVLVFLSRYPPNTITSKTLQDKVISLLWYDLAHPPASVVGQDYAFRTADGSGTSIWNPDMGKAGSPYARSVQGLHPLPANQLPSSELLFDTLLKREKQVDHPAGLSTFFFAFANLVIHSLFSTDHANPLTNPINKVSSYLDLSPIYGSSAKEQDSVRKKDGYGRLHPDTFADARLINMPPSTPALLICFARNHNYIVKRLLEINERGTWSEPPPSAEDKKKQQDEELFQTARLINCGWFMSTIFGDYLAAILGLVREGNSWSLDPLSEFRADSHEVVARGCGNVVSVEFLALYHFHSSIGKNDETWAEAAFKYLFKTDDWDSITLEKYKEVIQAQIDSATKGDNVQPPNKWEFNRMKRNPETGAFDDADLAKCLQDATSWPASAFKARGTPHVMRIIEIVAIEQNRAWGTCSLNEFRKFLGLKPYSTFKEWNPRPDIAEAAERLYQHPDNIELYVGLQAEDSKEVVPGAGLCPGYTMSRAILADAVALVRGDRFLTNDFTAFNLTSWGITDCSRNPKNSAHGGQLGKMLLRVLPNHYTPESSYTNFPFMVPSAIKKYFTNVGIADQYSFERPVPVSQAKALTTYDQVFSALANPSLKSQVPANAAQVLPGKGYLATYNDLNANVADRQHIANAFAPATALRKQYDFLGDTTRLLIKDRSYSLVGDGKRSVNIVRDVLNLVPIHFVSEIILGLPLKTVDRPHGSILDQEQYIKFREIYDFIFLNDDPSTKVANIPLVKEYVADLEKAVNTHLVGIATERIPIVGLVESAYKWVSGEPQEAHEWLARLVEPSGGHTRGELANDAVALAIIASVELSQAMIHVVDAFLPPQGDGPDHSLTISGLVKSLDRASDAQLKQYITAALRTRPPVPGAYRSLGAGPKAERVYLSFKDAGNDESVWGANAQPRFPPAQPLFAGALVNLLGPDWLVGALVPVVKAIFKLDGLKRAPGNSGKLLIYKQHVEGVKVPMYLDSKQQPTLWSSDLTITYKDTR